jgi:hypothetical protein
MQDYGWVGTAVMLFIIFGPVIAFVGGLFFLRFLYRFITGGRRREEE